MDYPIRINKYLRDSGLASRREADKLVEDGLVTINGAPAKNGTIVQDGDEVAVKGPKKAMVYLAYYKPRGLATQDLPGKPSVISQFASQGLYPVGRLDKESEGLLILTNDGRLVREILSENPIYEKEYIVHVKEAIRAGIPAIFESGMKTESLGTLLPAKAELLGKSIMRVILNEGKRHQIRVMMSELHYTITSLKRVRIGTINLGNLKPGDTRSIQFKI